jgi:hypothetical protein
MFNTFHTIVAQYAYISSVFIQTESEVLVDGWRSYILLKFPEKFELNIKAFEMAQSSCLLV